MDEVLDNREDLLYFDALGRWQTILNENGQYEKVFVAGEDIIRPLRHILRYHCFINRLMHVVSSKKKMRNIGSIRYN